MKYTVVVAEDEELLLNNLVQKIQKADPDFQVTGTAQTGEQAFALVEKLTPDLVITDIRMPVMDGYEAARRIRQLEEVTNITTPVIAVTADSLPEDINQAMKSGMNGHVSKPVDYDELVDIIRNAKRG